MLAYSTSLLPLNPRTVATISVSPYNRGPGFGTTPWKSGLRGGCGCSPVTGCGCGSTLKGLGQAPAWDQVAVDWFNRIFGAVTGQPPAGSTVPVPGSPGYYTGSIPPWVPWVIIGFVAYKIIK